TSHNRREHPHDRRDLRLHAEAKRLFHPEYCKEGDSQRVEEHERPLQLVEGLEEPIRHDNAYEYCVEKVDITDPDERIASKHDITQCSATDGCDERHEACGEKIVLLVADCERPGYREDERPH